MLRTLGLLHRVFSSPPHHTPNFRFSPNMQFLQTFGT